MTNSFLVKRVCDLEELVLKLTNKVEDMANRLHTKGMLDKHEIDLYFEKREVETNRDHDGT